jgi:hypothetical protein
VWRRWAQSCSWGLKAICPHSLVETRRLNGKVHHEHVASLGFVETPPSVPERIAFWLKLHDRLGKLSNRIDAATQGKVLGAVHARIAMVTADEQRALQLENAEADAQFWSNFRDMKPERGAPFRLPARGNRRDRTLRRLKTPVRLRPTSATALPMISLLRN